MRPSNILPLSSPNSSRSSAGVSRGYTSPMRTAHMATSPRNDVAPRPPLPSSSTSSSEYATPRRFDSSAGSIANSSSGGGSILPVLTPPSQVHVPPIRASSPNAFKRTVWTTPRSPHDAFASSSSSNSAQNTSIQTPLQRTSRPLEDDMSYGLDDDDDGYASYTDDDSERVPAAYMIDTESGMNSDAAQREQHAYMEQMYNTIQILNAELVNERSERARLMMRTTDDDNATTFGFPLYAFGSRVHQRSDVVDIDAPDAASLFVEAIPSSASGQSPRRARPTPPPSSSSPLSQPRRSGGPPASSSATPSSTKASLSKNDVELCATLGKNAELRIRTKELAKSAATASTQLDDAHKQQKLVERRIANREEKLRVLLKEKLAWQKELTDMRDHVVEEKMRQVELFRRLETAKREHAAQLEARDLALRDAVDENERLRALVTDARAHAAIQTKRLEDVTRQACDDKDRLVACIAEMRHKFKAWRDGEAAALQSARDQAVGNVRTEYELKLARHRDEKQKLRDKVQDLEVSLRLLQKDRTLSPLELSLRKATILSSKDSAGTTESELIEAHARIRELEALLAHAQANEKRQTNSLTVAEATISRLVQESEVTALEHMSMQPLATGTYFTPTHSPLDNGIGNTYSAPNVSSYAASTVSPHASLREAAKRNTHDSGKSAAGSTCIDNSQLHTKPKASAMAASTPLLVPKTPPLPVPDTRSASMSTSSSAFSLMPTSSPSRLTRHSVGSSNANGSDRGEFVPRRQDTGIAMEPKPRVELTPPAAIHEDVGESALTAVKELPQDSPHDDEATVAAATVVPPAPSANEQFLANKVAHLQLEVAELKARGLHYVNNDIPAVSEIRRVGDASSRSASFAPFADNEGAASDAADGAWDDDSEGDVQRDVASSLLANAAVDERVASEKLDEEVGEHDNERADEQLNVSASDEQAAAVVDDTSNAVEDSIATVESKQPVDRESSALNECVQDAAESKEVSSPVKSTASGVVDADADAEANVQGAAADMKLNDTEYDDDTDPDDDEQADNVSSDSDTGHSSMIIRSGAQDHSSAKHLSFADERADGHSVAVESSDTVDAAVNDDNAAMSDDAPVNVPEDAETAAAATGVRSSSGGSQPHTKPVSSGNATTEDAGMTDNDSVLSTTASSDTDNNNSNASVTLMCERSSSRSESSPLLFFNGGEQCRDDETQARASSPNEQQSASSEQDGDAVAPPIDPADALLSTALDVSVEATELTDAAADNDSDQPVAVDLGNQVRAQVNAVASVMVSGAIRKGLHHSIVLHHQQRKYVSKRFVLGVLHNAVGSTLERPRIEPTETELRDDLGNLLPVRVATAPSVHCSESPAPADNHTERLSLLERTADLNGPATVSSPLDREPHKAFTPNDNVGAESCSPVSESDLLSVESAVPPDASTLVVVMADDPDPNAPAASLTTAAASTPASPSSVDFEHVDVAASVLAKRFVLSIQSNAVALVVAAQLASAATASAAASEPTAIATADSKVSVDTESIVCDEVAAPSSPSAERCLEGNGAAVAIEGDDDRMDASDAGSATVGSVQPAPASNTDAIVSADTSTDTPADLNDNSRSFCASAFVAAVEAEAIASAAAVLLKQQAQTTRDMTGASESAADDSERSAKAALHEGINCSHHDLLMDAASDTAAALEMTTINDGVGDESSNDKSAANDIVTESASLLDFSCNDSKQVAVAVTVSNVVDAVADQDASSTENDDDSQVSGTTLAAADEQRSIETEAAGDPSCSTTSDFGAADAPVNDQAPGLNSDAFADVQRLALDSEVKTLNDTHSERLDDGNTDRSSQVECDAPTQPAAADAVADTAVDDGALLSVGNSASAASDAAIESQVCLIDDVALVSATLSAAATATALVMYAAAHTVAVDSSELNEPSYAAVAPAANDTVVECCDSSTHETPTGVSDDDVDAHVHDFVLVDERDGCLGQQNSPTHDSCSDESATQRALEGVATRLVLVEASRANTQRELQASDTSDGAVVSRDVSESVDSASRGHSEAVGNGDAAEACGLVVSVLVASIEQGAAASDAVAREPDGSVRAITDTAADSVIDGIVSDTAAPTSIGGDDALTAPDQDVGTADSTDARRAVDMPTDERVDASTVNVDSTDEKLATQLYAADTTASIEASEAANANSESGEATVVDEAHFEPPFTAEPQELAVTPLVDGVSDKDLSSLAEIDTPSADASSSEQAETRNVSDITEESEVPLAGSICTPPTTPPDAPTTSFKVSWALPSDAERSASSPVKSRRTERRRTSRRIAEHTRLLNAELMRDPTLAAYDAHHEQSQPFALLDDTILSIDPHARHMQFDENDRAKTTELQEIRAKRKNVEQDNHRKSIAYRSIPAFNYAPVLIRFQWSDFVVATPIALGSSGSSSSRTSSCNAGTPSDRKAWHPASPVKTMRLLAKKGVKLACGSYVIISAFIRPLEDGNENVRIHIYDAEWVEEFQYDFAEDQLKDYMPNWTGRDADATLFMRKLEFRREEGGIIIKMPDKVVDANDRRPTTAPSEAVAVSTSKEHPLQHDHSMPTHRGSRHSQRSSHLVPEQAQSQTSRSEPSASTLLPSDAE